MVNNKVLIIDDEEVVLESIRKDISEDQYEILSATNGEEGLVKYKEEQPSLIILDLRMPIMDGIEFLEHLKLTSSDSCAIIALTGHGDEEEIKRCFDLGVSTFIRKPYNIYVLRGTVRNAIELKQSQQKLINEIEVRNEAEVALRESEEKYRTLFADAGDALFILEADQENGVQAVECNQRSLSLFGCKTSDIIGKNPALFSPEIQPDGRFSKEKAVEIIKLVMADQPQCFQWLHYRHDDRKPFYVEVNLSRIALEGKSNYIQAVVRDITKSKRLEEELHKFQKLESIGTLAGGIAHDFNNYLQGILSNNSMALALADPNLKFYKNLVETKKVVHLAKNLTQQLLTFSKGGDPIKKVVSFSELIKNSVTFAIRGSNIKCEFGLPDYKCHAEVDKEQIHQVISNMVVNASHAMPGGGIIKVNVELCNVEKESLLPIQDGEYIKLTIKDRGTGISHENLQKIFDPYFTTKEMGSGLGLSAAFSIIRKHNGCIDVESEIGVGTTFYIYLPASQKEALKDPDKSKKKEASPELEEGENDSITLNGKILIMDDEDIIRTIIGEHMRLRKYEVEVARDGSEAIALYKKAMESGKPHDVVILDLTIPGGMGGKETIEKLLEIDPEVKAIVISGYSDDPVMTDFDKYGFKGVVEKPFDIDTVDTVLQKVITGKNNASHIDKVQETE